MKKKLIIFGDSDKEIEWRNVLVLKRMNLHRRSFSSKVRQLMSSNKDFKFIKKLKYLKMSMI